MPSAVLSRPDGPAVEPAAARFDHQMRSDAVALHTLGLRQPCVVLGQPGWSEALACASGCRNVPRAGAAIRHLRSLGTEVVWLGPTTPPVRYGPGWRQLLLPGAGATQVAYLSRALPSG